MSFSVFDHSCMALAMRLAENGLFTAHPNPRVGCVIARDEQVIGKGWHEFAGGPHAEVRALEAVNADVRGATAYVTLEPCSHQGNTPPCSQALISAGIERVIFAIEDPNTLVNGGGRRLLQQQGIKVESGLMMEAAEALNAGFLMRMRQGRPWVRVKLAASLDGRTALRNGDSKWITGESSRQDVQKWRARSSAILTGIGTVLADDPSMTARVEDPPLQPLRVIADTHWRTPANSQILNDSTTAIVAGGVDFAIPEELAACGVECLPLPLDQDRIDLSGLMKVLATRGVNELQVEAGADLCGSLLSAGLIDEVLLYQAPVLLGEGGSGLFSIGPLESMHERTHLEVLESCRIGDDLRLRLKPDNVAITDRPASC